MRICRGHATNGFLLAEVVGYMVVLFLVLGLALAAFYSGWENHRRLIRNTDEIIRAVEAGERWREDIRSATGPPILESSQVGQLLRIPTGENVVVYQAVSNTVVRSDSGGSSELLKVNSSEMSRGNPGASRIVWQWEVELEAAAEAARVRPLFSFKAVARP